MNIFNLNSTLDKSGISYVCPKCGKKSFSKYVYNCNNEIVGDKYGYCKRGWYCQYHLIPSYNFIENDVEVFKKDLYGVNEYDLSEFGFNNFHEGPEVFTHTIPEQVLLDSMYGCGNSNFAKFLLKYLEQNALRLINEYYVGLSSADDSAANIFWRVDDNFIVRNGVVAYYSSDYGCKYDSKNIDVVYDPKTRFYTLFNCFFGAHLINLYPEKDIAIVEDEKTAIVASHFWPEFNWLATGEIERLHWREYAVYNILKGKNITFYSDFKTPVLESSSIGEEVWIEMKNYIENEIYCKIEVKSLFRDKINTLDESDEDLIFQLLKMPKFQ